MELDDLDRKAAEAFPGYIVRKDLVNQFKGQYPVPTYVVEFLLGRYCASTDEAEIHEGLQIVQRQLASRTVRPGEEELFKARAQRTGQRQADRPDHRPPGRQERLLPGRPCRACSSTMCASTTELVHEHERMLTGGFYAEIDLWPTTPCIAQEKNGRPFGIEALRPIQLSNARCPGHPGARRGPAFHVPEWKDFLLRSVGLEPPLLAARAQDAMLLRMVPFVENNYNVVELGPRGTGKSHLFQQISPYAHLVSGGKATVARMFVNNSNGQRGLVCQYDVVCFDEVSGISFDQKDGVNIMKGYMESGSSAAGKESIRGVRRHRDGRQLRGGCRAPAAHRPPVRAAAARRCATTPPSWTASTPTFPGWDVPKLHPRACSPITSAW